MSLVIGMNSGSSFDGIDAVLVEISLNDQGGLGVPRFIDGMSFAWPTEVQSMVLDSFANKLDIFELSRLNYIVGGVFADCALDIMRKNNLEGKDVEVIGYDGQTIYQQYPTLETGMNVSGDIPTYMQWTVGGYGYGLYIGDPTVVATKTDTYVVTRFRPMDHSLQGTGAPLIQYIDYVLLRDYLPTITLNIGGIANVHYACSDRARLRGFDTGPGNVMIDHAMRRYFDRKYDNGGIIAAEGKVNQELLKVLLSHPFLRRPIPRNAWRWDFGGEYADKIFGEFSSVEPRDIVATVTEFTAETIVRGLQMIPELTEVTTIIASGGGILNTTLVESIRRKLGAGHSIVSLDVYGFPAPYKEALECGVQAYAYVNDIASNSPLAEGAIRYGILGELTKPPRIAKVI